jgi:Ca2+-binding RTX toxin-like protein
MSLPGSTHWNGSSRKATRDRFLRSGRLALAVTVAAATAALTPAAPAHAAAATCHGVRATIVGTSASDVIHGTPGRDVIAALAGNDAIDARGGNDLVCGGEGADRIYGGPGNDRLYGGLDLFTGPVDEDGSTRSGDTLRGGPGNDHLDAGVDTISWATSAHGIHLDLRSGRASGQGTDTFTGGTLAVVGSFHADVVEGSNRADQIATGAGSDVVRGRGGNDIVTVDGSSRGRFGDADQVWGGAGKDRITATHGRDHLFGGAGNDDIESFGSGNDVLSGGTGDDFFYAEIGDTTGSQIWDGGEGHDGIRVGSDGINTNKIASTGTWDMATGAMTLILEYPISLAVTHVESALFASSSATIPDTAWTITGTTGNDAVSGAANQAVPLYFDGLAGDDSFRGTDGDDVFNGGPGNDYTEAMFGGEDTCISVEAIHLSDCEHVS